YTFEDTAKDGNITLGNGITTQTIRIATMLDGTAVATGTQIIANFDRLGVQVTLAGPLVAKDKGAYVDGELNKEKIVVKAGTGGSFQVGPTDNAFNRIEVGIADMMGTGATLRLTPASVSTIVSARDAITSLDQAITEVIQQRGDLGAFQNRLAFSLAYIENEIEQIQASEATVSDADIAEEVAEFTRAQILSQAATAMLAQANVMPQNALALLQ
ncbi:MAG: flagellin, partial [Candidatus Latescibacterota bacterium]|nr:flagellin [Candidatus Latescibacterota bacterium]